MDLPQLIKINDKIIPIAKETPFNERFGSWINLRFLIIKTLNGVFLPPGSGGPIMF